MPDIIRLLPENIANQIAAGEVVQRPASVVKELLENALDAGSTSVRLIVKDAGKTSIQVIDDGAGMTATDARMAFERHATSKIKTADDLFRIRTMGFRGEALASIASIAHVELITRMGDDEMGTRLLMEGSKKVLQEVTQALPGTSITVKNLFFNVPARRKFLKSDPVELKHITEEFHRVAIAHPSVHFTFHHNGNEVYHLPKGNVKQRIVGILGKSYAEKLIPVEEKADIVDISGFVGKPDTARKTASDQYLFVNNRFVKSPLLHHAIRSAFEDVIAPDMQPFYFLFLETDPGTIDVNVHPTKTEIKFEEERLIYNYLKVSVKHSLGQYTLSPMLDFSHAVQMKGFLSGKEHAAPSQYPQANYPGKNERTSTDNWQEIYKGLQGSGVGTEAAPKNDLFSIASEASILSPAEEVGISPEALYQPTQLHQSFILHPVRSGLLVVDQQAAHERILYEHYLDILQTGEYASQKELFPRTIQLDARRAGVLQTMLTHLQAVGFELEDFGHHSFILHGSPAGLEESAPVDRLIEHLIDKYSSNIELHLGVYENIARSLAFSASLKRGKRMEKEEMQQLLQRLFSCDSPYRSPGGRKCFFILELEELARRFTQ